MKKIAGSLHNFKNIINNKLQTESTQRSECVSALEDDIKALEEELSKIKAQLDEQFELPRLTARSVTSGICLKAVLSVLAKIWNACKWKSFQDFLPLCQKSVRQSVALQFTEKMTLSATNVIFRLFNAGQLLYIASRTSAFGASSRRRRWRQAWGPRASAATAAETAQKLRFAQA